MTKKSKSMTAAEHDAICRADPEWVRDFEEREAKHQARVARLREEMEPEAAPLMAELAAAGVTFRPSKIVQWESKGTITSSDPIPLRTISDLVSTKSSYPEAIPILYKHLRTARHPVMVESLARALTVKEACGPQARGILEKFQRMDFLESTPARPRSEARWCLANALTVVGDETMVEEIKALMADPRHADIKRDLNDALRHCESVARRKPKGKKKAGP